MTIRRACYVSCDVCGDPAETSTWGADDARRAARDQGYAQRVVKGTMRDICPRHQELTPAELASAVRAWVRA